MKIERKIINETIRGIEEGECFKNADGRIFIKTRDEDMHKRLCVNLENGEAIWFDADRFVKPIRIKAVEE